MYRYLLINVTNVPYKCMMLIIGEIIGVEYMETSIFTTFL